MAYSRTILGKDDQREDSWAFPKERTMKNIFEKIAANPVTSNQHFLILVNKVVSETLEKLKAAEDAYQRDQ